MPYSLHQQLKLFSRDRFEELCGQLLKAGDPSVVSVEGSGGDEGIDMFKGPLDTPKDERAGEDLHVWQVKHFPTGLGVSQKKQAVKSLRRVIATQDPNSWTLCVPFEFSLGDRRWIEDLRKEYGPLITEPLDAPGIVDLLLRPEHKSLLDAHFLLPTDQRIEKNVLDLLTDFDLVSERLRADRLPTKTESEFYNGAVADWKDIHDNLDARREIIGELWDFVIEAEKSTGAVVPFAVLTGLSGEGKSTVLRRLAAELVRSGRNEVFWHKGSSYDLSSEQFDHLPKGALVYIFVDSIMLFDPDAIGGFLQRLRDFPIRPIVIGAAISSQWDGLKLNVGSFARVREIELAHMSLADVESLLDKLSEDEERASENLGKLAELSREEQINRFTEGADRQLLVALIEAKGGQGFEQHVLDELRKLGDEDKALIRQACVYVSALHRFDLRMPKRLLQRLLGKDVLLEDQVLSKTHGLIRLISDDDTVITRHPLVAQIIYGSVGEAGLEYYQRIITATDKLDMELVDGVILTMARSADLSIAVIVANMADGHFSTDGKVFVRHAIRLEVRGHVDNARAFLRRATEVQPDVVGPWTHWARLERRQENYGSVGGSEAYTARWLYLHSVELEPHDPALWREWAALEIKEGNYGTFGKPEEYTARWLYLEGTKANPKDPRLWEAWAAFESGQGKCGTPITPEEFTARCIYKKGTEENPDDRSLWEKWSELERRHGSYGTPGEPEKYSSRWFCQNRIKGGPDEDEYWVEWAQLECENGNCGTPGKPEEYTARWLYLKATETLPKSLLLWDHWLDLERQQRNYGTRGTPEQHTVRWIFLHATLANPDFYALWQDWVEFEYEQGNYGTCGDPAQCSLRWVYQKATEANPDEVCLWEQWAELEVELGNWDEVERLLLRAADSEPDTDYRIRVWEVLANLFQESWDMDKVIVYLNLLIQYDPGDHLARARLAKAYYEEELYKEANRECRAALKLTPDDDDLQELHGEIKRAWRWHRRGLSHRKGRR